MCGFHLLPYLIRRQSIKSATTMLNEDPKKGYKEWWREQLRKNYRQNQTSKIGVKVLPLNSDEISKNENGEDIVPDTRVHVEEDIVPGDTDMISASWSCVSPQSWRSSARSSPKCAIDYPSLENNIIILFLKYRELLF